MNLKVGWEGGTHQARKNMRCCCDPPPFWLSTISGFGERFHDGQCSLVSFSFAVFLLMVPTCPAQPFVQVGMWGARAPILPYMESAPLAA